MPEKKIINLSDVLETKLRKEKELEFYQDQLEKLQTKMMFLQKDIDITNIIIRMLENENIFDLEKSAFTKIPILGKGDNDE